MENQKIKLLIVDDEDAFRELLMRRFDNSEFQVTGCRSGEEALDQVRAKGFDVGVLDIRMPGISGVDLLREIKEQQPNFEGIMLTGQATIDSAIETMKIGAYDYLAKPCKLFELDIIIRKAFEKKMLAEQNIKLRDELSRKQEKADLVGSSKIMADLIIQVENFAKLDEPALIQGEEGAGKEVTALALHQKSSRASQPYVTINCGVLAEGMLELELFGHEANAFVGAVNRKKGIIENVSGGTVFLDEIDQMSPAMQVKILHFLETGEFRRVGGAADITADTRLIFGTTEDLLNKTQGGKFREDFFYKISTLTLLIPPLRDRKEDIPEIASYIIGNSSIAASRNKRLSKKALDALMKYNWPSNIRELKNVLERSIGISSKNVIQLKDLPLSFEKKSKTSRQRHLLSLSEIEREHILHVLDAVNGNISKASRILGISRPKLYRKLEKYRTGPGS